MPPQKAGYLMGMVIIPLTDLGHGSVYTNILNSDDH